MVTISRSDLITHQKSEQSGPSVDFFTVFKSTMVKDFQIQMRYKQNFVGQFIRTLAFILIFYLFSLSFVFKDLPNSDVETVFLFYIAALILMMYDGVALYSPYNSVRRDLYNGTLEAIYQTPSSRFAYYLGGIFASAVYNSVFVIPLLTTIIVIVKPNFNTILLIFATLGISLLTLMSMGILIGLSAILWKNMGAMLNIFSMIFQFATGTIIPFASLPKFAQYVGYIFPITWGLDLIRFYIFEGSWSPIYSIPVMWGILLFQLLIFLTLAKILLGSVEKYSKKRGLHLL